MLPIKRLRCSAGVLGVSTKPSRWLLFCGVPETPVLLFVKYLQCKFLSILSTSRGMARSSAPLPQAICGHTHLLAVPFLQPCLFSLEECHICMCPCICTCFPSTLQEVLGTPNLFFKVSLPGEKLVTPLTYIYR